MAPGDRHHFSAQKSALLQQYVTSAERALDQAFETCQGFVSQKGEEEIDCSGQNGTGCQCDRLGATKALGDYLGIWAPQRIETAQSIEEIILQWPEEEIIGAVKEVIEDARTKAGGINAK